MEAHQYEITEVVGNSHDSLESAIANAISNAADASRHLRSFTVIDTRGTISDDKVESWQVTLKIGYTFVG